MELIVLDLARGWVVRPPPPSAGIEDAVCRAGAAGMEEEVGLNVTELRLRPGGARWC
jgi:hypothetical protein